MAYQRRHRIFFTRHTEYHLRGDECVGVRDRATHTWLLDHPALRLRALKLPTVYESARWVGKRIQFWSSRTDVLTSPVLGVGRPRRDEVDAYVSQARAGTIGVAETASTELRASLPSSRVSLGL